MTKAPQKFRSDIRVTDLIFDFDRTICTLHLDWTDWGMHVGEIIRSFRKDFSDHMEGVNMFQRQNTYIAQFGTSLADRIKMFVTRFESSGLRGYTANDDVVEWIRNNSQFRLHIWSSNAKSTIQSILSELNLADAFVRVISRDDVCYIKPHPEGFWKIRQRGQEETAYLMVGDSSYDRDASINAGIRFVDVRDFGEYFPTPM